MENVLTETVKELLNFIEENNICDEHKIAWITDEDCYIEGERSTEMKELIQKVQDCIGEE